MSLKMRYLMKKESIFYLQREAWDDIKEYEDNFKQVIRQREKNRIPFFHQSPQFNFRGYLVEYIKRICIEKRLTHCCLHLAVYLLDVFMDSHSIVPERVFVVANVCLLLAAKFEENTTNIPKIIELNSAINNKYTAQDYKELEIIILKFFHWYIMFPTAAHYVHYYIQGIISSDDLKSNTSLRSLFYDLHDNITTYLDYVVDNIHYMQCYTPSKLAAAIICASRLEVGLNGWTNQLKNLTDYTPDDFQDPLITLMTKKNSMTCLKCTTISNI
ncbi:cyclin-J [Aethina tumida]|uniref:cyclin-J n=1 Tax=Aethina tumida TaxID=116153 RepID=UPI0021481166|nr:cyclin-J [Aethina tumida]